jgi:hypothetical protein
VTPKPPDEIREVKEIEEKGMEKDTRERKGDTAVA